MSSPLPCPRYREKWWRKNICVNCTGKKEMHSAEALNPSSNDSSSSTPQYFPSSSPRMSPRASPSSSPTSNTRRLDDSQIHAAIGERLKQAFQSGDLRAIATKLDQLKQFIMDMKLSQDKQTLFLTKIAQNIIRNVTANIERTRDLRVCFLLANVSGLVDVCDQSRSPPPMDRFEYSPCGGCDIREIINDYLFVLYEIVEQVAHMNGMLPEMDELNYEVLGILTPITGNILGRCFSTRKSISITHYNIHRNEIQSESQDGVMMKMMDQMRTYMIGLRHASNCIRILSSGLHILDDEIIAVIHCRQQWGFHINIRGITVNEQLLTMITDVCYQYYPSIVGNQQARPPFPRPSEQVMSVMTGVGPQMLPREIRYTYVFAMFQWYAPERTESGSIECEYLDNPARIDGVGFPSDIAICPYTSNRVIILDEPTMFGGIPISQQSNVLRDFTHMHADCSMHSIIPPQQVQALLHQMVNTPQQQRQQAQSYNNQRINRQAAQPAGVKKMMTLTSKDGKTISVPIGK